MISVHSGQFDQLAWTRRLIAACAFLVLALLAIVGAAPSEAGDLQAANLRLRSRLSELIAQQSQMVAADQPTLIRDVDRAERLVEQYASIRWKPVQLHGMFRWLFAEHGLELIELNLAEAPTAWQGGKPSGIGQRKVVLRGRGSLEAMTRVLADLRQLGVRYALSDFEYSGLGRESSPAAFAMSLALFEGLALPTSLCVDGQPNSREQQP